MRVGLRERSLERFAPGVAEGHKADLQMQNSCLNYLLGSSSMCKEKRETPSGFPDLASCPMPLSHQRY